MKNTPEEMLVRAHSLQTEEETKKLYQDWADSYDETMIDGLGYQSPQNGAELLAALELNSDPLILDVGTGTGLVGKEMKARGYQRIDGLDYSAPMLKVAAETGAYTRLFEADLNQPLDIKDKTYDALICIGTFTHGHVGPDCLDELFRVLVSGGKFVTAIRKNYIGPSGFEAKFEELNSSGICKLLLREERSNYADSGELETWYMAWEKS